MKSRFGGKTCIGFTATGETKREKYGMTWNEATEGGAVVMGKDVQLTIDLEADLTTD